MKTLTILTALICAGLSLKAQSKYHIRVEKEILDTYAIWFTNDNWAHKTPIKSFSGSSYGKHEFLLGSDRWEVAVEMAKKFKTYQSCIEYNRQQELLYLEWKKFQNPKRNKTIQIY